MTSFLRFDRSLSYLVEIKYSFASNIFDFWGDLKLSRQAGVLGTNSGFFFERFSQTRTRIVGENTSSVERVYVTV
jgi:hypothetical protein